MSWIWNMVVRCDVTLFQCLSERQKSTIVPSVFVDNYCFSRNKKKSKINWPCEPAPQLGTNNCLNSKILGLRARGNVINLIVCLELDDIKRPPWSCDVMLITLYRAIFLCNTYDVLLRTEFVYQRHNVDNVLVWNLVLVWDKQHAYWSILKLFFIVFWSAF